MPNLAGPALNSIYTYKRQGLLLSDHTYVACCYIITSNHILLVSSDMVAADMVSSSQTAKPDAELL